MQNESSHGSSSRERVAENVYRRRTKRGELVYEVVFRDADGTQRRKRLDARSERAAIREARAVLAQRDGGDRVVAADLTLGELAEREYWPMLDGLAAAGRRSERGVELYRTNWRLYVEPDLGHVSLAELDVRAPFSAPAQAARPTASPSRRFTARCSSCGLSTDSPSVAGLSHDLRSTGSTPPSCRGRSAAARAECSPRRSSQPSPAMRLTTTGRS